MGMLEDFLRMLGFKIISEDERHEAQRIGAAKAMEIYEPIFKLLVLQHEMLEKLVNDRKTDYEEKKKIIKNRYDSLKNEIAVLEQKFREKNGVILGKKPERMKMAVIDCIATDYLSLKRLISVSKEEVLEYKKAIEYGFNKTQKIYEQKIESELKKIDEENKKLSDFTKTTDQSFEQAQKHIDELLMKRAYYKAMLEE